MVGGSEKRNSAFHTLLTGTRSICTVSGQAPTSIGRGDGSDFLDYISNRSFLLLKREAPGGLTETFHDYRKVGDVLMPFEADRDDSSGHTVMKVKRDLFDTHLSGDLFQPGYRHCRQ